MGESLNIADQPVFTPDGRVALGSMLQRTTLLVCLRHLA
jgi:hypothetical protein